MKRELRYHTQVRGPELSRNPEILVAATMPSYKQVPGSNPNLVLPDCLRSAQYNTVENSGIIADHGGIAEALLMQLYYGALVPSNWFRAQMICLRYLDCM